MINVSNGVCGCGDQVCSSGRNGQSSTSSVSSSYYTHLNSSESTDSQDNGQDRWKVSEKVRNNCGWFGCGTYNQSHDNHYLLLGSMSIMNQVCFICISIALCLLIMVVPHTVHLMVLSSRDLGRIRWVQVISFISRWVIKRAKQRPRDIPNTAFPGTISSNELDTHSNTHCYGYNWGLMKYTGYICKLVYLIHSCEPSKDIPVVGWWTI